MVFGTVEDEYLPLTRGYRLIEYEQMTTRR